MFNLRRPPRQLRSTHVSEIICLTKAWDLNITQYESWTKSVLGYPIRCHRHAHGPEESSSGRSFRQRVFYLSRHTLLFPRQEPLGVARASLRYIMFDFRSPNRLLCGGEKRGAGVGST